jgi:4-amino-4-deoxy-L-arabinose transferase-like glycosyltransferase
VTATYNNLQLPNWIGKKAVTLLLVVFLASTAVRVALIDKRWVNPDEGAHLMDAALVLDGHMPVVDFNSRQPFYTYVIAGVFLLGGEDLSTGRMMPLVCSLLCGLIIFSMAGKIFDQRVALLSTILYWLLPLEVINSVVVKTEPLVTLLICLSIWTMIRYRAGSCYRWLFVSGLLTTLGYFVRQSALILPMLALGYLVVIHGKNIRKIATGYTVYCLGCVCVFCIVFLGFVSIAGIDMIYDSSLNPLGFVAKMLSKITHILGLSADSTVVKASALPEVPDYQAYFAYILQAIYMHSFLLIGAGFSVLTCMLLFWRQKTAVTSFFQSYAIFWLWVLLLAVAYGYYFFARGFYIDYAREFFPPLVVIFSAWIVFVLDTIGNKKVARAIGLAFVLGIILFLIRLTSAVSFDLNRYFYYICLGLLGFAFLESAATIEKVTHFLVVVLVTVVIAIASLGIFHVVQLYNLSALFEIIIWSSLCGLLLFSMILQNRGKGLASLMYYPTYVGVAMAFATFITCSAYAGSLLRLEYDSIWSPKTVDVTADYLRTNTKKGDTVISGAVIWELQANRRPFGMISHPLGILYHMGQSERELFKRNFDIKPPRAIVYDGYMERIYLKHLPWLQDRIEKEYHRKEIADTATKFPISVYIRSQN